MTTQTQIVMSTHVNGSGRLFGGHLMAWIDVAAAVEARRHTHHEVTTVTVDSLEFLVPVNLNEIVVLEARVTWTGRTSIEVRVDTFVEDLNGNKSLVNVAYVVFVALDAGRPCEVRAFTPVTEEEKVEYTAAEARRALRLMRRSRGKLEHRG